MMRLMVGPSLWRVCDETECSIYLLLEPLSKMLAALGIPTECFNIFFRCLWVESKVTSFHGVAQRLVSLLLTKEQV